MKGRDVRVISPTDFKAVTPDAPGKTHFVVVDCVGQCEQALTDSKPLERKRNVAFEKLLQSVAFGSTDPDILSSLASRLTRLERQLGPADRKALADTAHGQALGAIAAGLLAALDPDRHIDAARAAAGLAPDAQPTPEQVEQAAATLRQQAAAPLAGNLDLRRQLLDMRQRYEQTIDTVSKDTVLEAGYSADARERAGGLVASFEAFLREHKDEISALQVLYSRPYAGRLRLADVKALAAAIKAPLRLPGDDPDGSLGPLWRAYETLERSKVRGAAGRRLWTDVVSLVQFALHQEDELAPFPEQVTARFLDWFARQEAAGRTFTDEQRGWLELIRDHVAANLSIDLDDFDMVPFNQRGGLGKVYALFGDQLGPLLDELNEVLAA
jgi:type I restriction enzyme R subunit